MRRYLFVNKNVSIINVNIIKMATIILLLYFTFFFTLRINIFKYMPYMIYERG